ncbi:MAG: RHS repeat-associated core domain-containing protein [Betaproteobacteria bacterium]|nr:RHS repeat-associated core domain-containing protein [Betaproteobacteria bacterium]
MASIETAGLNIAFVHDGKLKKQETLTGPVAGSIAFTHDENFRITAVSVNGENVPLAHDPDGLLTQAGDLTLTRDTASGLVTGTNLANLTTTQGYNPFGELASFQASHNANALLHYTLSYDPLGRITAKDETVGGATTAFQYQYDPAGRLEEVRRDGSTTTRYGYDANGNRSELNGSSIATYDDQDRLLTYAGTTYSYTANGTLTQKTEGSQITQYVYDAFGNLRSVTLPDGTQIDNLVDGKNRRVGKKVNGALTQGWLYQDQLKIAAEFDGSGALVSRFVYGTKVNVPEYMQKGGKTYRLVTDHLGSVRVVVDAASGDLAQRIDYDEFGKVLSDTHPGFQPFGFAGGLYDPQTRLVRFGARDYDAQTGRWTAKDPIRFAGLDENLYSYVGGNPISNTDPTGLLCFDFDQFVDDIRDNRIDLDAVLASLLGDLAAGTMPKTPEELRALGIPKDQINPYTSQLSRWSGRLEFRTLRELGRTGLGILLGAALTGAVVFEGFYDWSVIVQAALGALSDGDCACQK